MITMSVAALLASVMEIFAPKEWEKYINLAIGLIILSIILSPVAKFCDAEILPPTPSYKIDENAFYDEIASSMKQNVERDICERLQTEFGVAARAEVSLTIDSEHNIKGVDVIRIYTWKNPDGMIERLKTVYGCDKVEIRLE